MTHKSGILWLSALFLMATVPGKGHLKFDDSFKDTGTVKKGSLQTYAFAFTNTGEKKIRITSVIAYSECLSVQPIKDSIIEPDAGGDIVIVFDTNKHQIGDFSFAITVNSNADNKEVKLKMFGKLD